MANIVLAGIYIPTIVAGAVGEWAYFILGSAIEIGLLVGIVYYAWTWPAATDDAAAAGSARQ